MSAPIQPTEADRLLTAIRSIIRAELPQYTYLGLYEYAVQATDGTTIDCDPTDTTIPLPSLARVPLRSSIQGERAKPTVGSRCLIAFVNADPTRPICVSADPVAQTVQIAGGSLAAARVTDAVVVGAFGGTITTGSTKVTVG